MLAVVWTLGIVVGLSLPGEALTPLPLLSFDKLLHALAFFGFGVLWMQAYPRAARRVVVAGLLFAVLSEGYQHVMPIGRTLSPADALADVLGLAAGVGAVLGWRRRSAAS